MLPGWSLVVGGLAVVVDAASRQGASTLQVRISSDALQFFPMTPISSVAETAGLKSVAEGRSGDPFSVLGPHEATVDGRPAVIVRTLQPAASTVELITDGRVTPMPKRLAPRSS